MTDEPLRVTLPQPATWFSSADVATGIEPKGPKFARRFTVDIAEDALAKIGAAGLAAAVDDLGRSVAWRYERDVERAVHDLLRDREWAKPIIREAIREAVHRHIADIFAIAPETSDD